MESPKPYPRPNRLLSLSTFIHQHCLRLGAEISTRLEDTKLLAGTIASNFAPAASRRMRSAPVSPPFAWLAQSNHALAATLSSDHVAKSLAGTAVYTASNSNNEFVLISDPNEAKSIGLLCFRHEDAEALLSQVRSRRELRSAAKVVPITLDQVHMLKVEGIAFRFLPDPVQIRNALELKSADRSAFDGVPVFQEMNTSNFVLHNMDDSSNSRMSSAFTLLLTLKTTKLTWRASQLINKPTHHSVVCGACQLIGRARSESKICCCGIGHAHRLLNLATVAEEGTCLGLQVLELEDKTTSSAKFNIKFGFQHA